MFALKGFLLSRTRPWHRYVYEADLRNEEMTMPTRGYHRQPAQLAYRKSEHPERAYAIAQAAAEGIASNDLRELTEHSNEFLAQWQERAIGHLEATLADLASFSDEQLEVFTSIFRDAGIEIDLGHAPQPPSNYVWKPTARASVLALMDTLVDGPEELLSPAQWTEKCLTGLDTERFLNATGVNAGDESVVLRIGATSFFASDQGSELLLYRDRLARTLWFSGTVQVLHPDPMEAMPALQAAIGEHV
jgi:hypothetical protein